MYKKLLRREGASSRVMGHFYKAIVQAVLLYGSESWVLTPRLVTKLRSFHRKAVRFITNRRIRPKADESEEWVYPDSASVLEDAGLFEIETSIQRQRDTIFHNYLKIRKVIGLAGTLRRICPLVHSGGSRLLINSRNYYLTLSKTRPRLWRSLDLSISTTTITKQ